MKTIGTPHFLSLEAAWGYYYPYGYTMAQVQQMRAAGEIHTTRPTCKPGERVVILRDEGRYAIKTA